MDVTVLGLIVIGALGLIIIIKANLDKNKPEPQHQKEEEVRVENHEVKRSNAVKTPKKDVFEFMEFDKIEDDMIIRSGGDTFTMVIQCKGINYDLMSDVEQLAIEEGFIVFLNTLKFPVQIYVQARTVDLKKSMTMYKDRVDYFGKQYEEADSSFKKIINKLDATEREVSTARNERAKFANIYEYAADINRYVERLSLSKNILQRRFYIALSYNKSDITSVGSFNKEEIREICRRELYTRAQSLISSLMSCSVVGKVLDSDSLAELLYISYNRDDERILDIRSALETDFYRLYSTSKDIYDKKKEKLNEEVKQEAVKRVREAIQKTIRERNIKTQEQIEDEFDEAADREAIQVIRNSDISPEDKDTLATAIAHEHVKRENANRIARQRKAQEQEELEKMKALEAMDEEVENENTNEIEEVTYSDEPAQAEVNVKENEVFQAEVSEEPNIEENQIDPEELNRKLEDELQSKINIENDTSDSLYDDDDESIV